MNQDLKFQIIFFYYDRPNMSKSFALKSVLRSSYTNWEINFIDDSTKQNGEEIIEDFLEQNAHYVNSPNYFGEKINFADKISFYKTGNERVNGEAVFGKSANDAMEQSDADISLMLCDDDALLQDYLINLNNFYVANPDIKYSYCHLVEYDPSKLDGLKDIRYIEHGSGGRSQFGYDGFSLNHLLPLNPSCQVDSSQVSWRRKDLVDQPSMRFPSPRTRDLDAAIYSTMRFHWGDCCWNGLTGQYKGWFHDQLGQRDSSGGMGQVGDYEIVYNVKSS